MKENDFFTSFGDLFIYENFEKAVNNVKSADVVRKYVSYVDEDGKTVLQVLAAGYDPDNIKVSVKDNVLYIKQIQTNDNSVSNKLSIDLNFKFRLNKTADYKNLTAVVKNGILTVTIPKKVNEEGSELDIKVEVD